MEKQAKREKKLAEKKLSEWQKKVLKKMNLKIEL